MFTGINKEELTEFKEIKITQQIKTIVGSKCSDGPIYLQNLSFKNKKDQQICSIDIKNIPTWEIETIEQHLEEREQIIGIYGNVEIGYQARCIGFIVWRPPKLE